MVRARRQQRTRRRSREGPPEATLSLDRSHSRERRSLDGAIAGGRRSGGSIRPMARVEGRRRTGLDAWRSRYDLAPLREGEVFTSISGAEVEPLATPETVDLDYERDLGYPGA